MKIILTRHGETEENKKRIIQGQSQGQLSELGREQAKKLAKRLEKEDIDLIFSSDLTRASDTAKEIAKFHKNTPLKFTEEIRERFLGKLQRQETPPNWKEILFDQNPPKKYELETLDEVLKRAKEFMEKINKNKNQTILLVGHRGINFALTCAILNKDSKEIICIKSQKNCAITILDMSDKQNPKIILDNCTKHLEE